MELNFVYIDLSELGHKLVQKFIDDPTVVLLISANNSHGMAEQRRLFLELMNKKCKTPVIITRQYKNMEIETQSL